MLAARAAQRRFASRNGYAGGGSQRGSSQFQRLGRTVGGLLEQLVRTCIVPRAPLGDAIAAAS